MKQSIHIAGGFWAHIVWNFDKSRGIDQHGRVWFDFKNPKCETAPWLKGVCEIIADAITLTTKAILI